MRPGPGGQHNRLMLAALRAHWFGWALAFDLLTYASLQDGRTAGWLLLDLFLFWRLSRGAEWARVLLVCIQIGGLVFVSIGVAAEHTSPEAFSTNATGWTLGWLATCLFFLLLPNAPGRPKRDVTARTAAADTETAEPPRAGTRRQPPAVPGVR